MAAPASHIVGVGSSAGGLDALEQFFRNMPPDEGLAFVVIQHLSPDFKSLMLQLLARHTTMAIEHAQDGMALQANTIYLIRPRKSLQLKGGVLVETERTDTHLHFPIDTFFESLAQEQGNRAIAIVLSGTGTDGTRGIRAIKEAAGLVMVQSEDSAQFDGMPRSAVRTGMADFVLPPAEMPAQLLRYIGHPYVQETSNAEQLVQQESKLGQVVQLLSLEHPADFSLYKAGTVARRIERRMGITHSAGLDDYIERLREQKDERATLARDLLIGVTRFFRDEPAWRSFRVALERRIAAMPADAPLRLWTVGCSTGEEAYTAAITVREVCEDLGRFPHAKIFATDIDAEAIATATTGSYPENVAPDVGTRRLHRFFRLQGDRYELRREVRELVVFAAHDALKDPPFTKIDAIVCRNMLIYFKPEAQSRVMALFHHALNPGGTLFLGSSESTEPLPDAFAAEHAVHRVFVRNDQVRVPLERTWRNGGVRAELVSGGAQRGRRSEREDDPVSAAERLRATTLAPPGLLLNDRWRVLRTFGAVSPFVRVPDGDFTADVLKLAAPSLRALLSTGLRRVAETHEAVVYTDLRLEFDTGPMHLRLRIDPVPDPAGGAVGFLVSFLEGSSGPQALAERTLADLEHDQSGRIVELEQELESVRATLQATLEEVESANEELQSTNEELIASNEELQSTNEELQSVNEELHTVNVQHQAKIAELTDLSNDFANLLKSTDIGTIFVDRQLRIRKFTPAAQRVFNLVSTDVDRPISHLTHRLACRDLVERLERVLASGQPSREEMRLVDAEQWFEVTARPFVDDHDAVAGVVVTLVDVTARRQAEDQSRLAIETAPSPIVLVDAGGRIRLANACARRLFGYEAGELDGQPIEVLVPRASRSHHAELRATYTSSPEPRPMSEGRDLDAVHRDGSVLPLEIGLHPFSAPGGMMVLVAVTDLRERRRAEGALRETATQMRLVLDHVPAMIAAFDREGRFRVANRAYCEWLGLEAEGIVGRRADEVLSEPLRAAIAPWWQPAFEGRESAFELPLDVGGRTRWIAGAHVPQLAEGRTLSGVYAFYTDVDSRKRAEALLEEQTLVDPLTGVRNRRGLDQSLAAILGDARRSGSRHAAIMLDVDDFKQINERLGHAVGDVVLIDVARKLREELRPEDVVARVGGDEFVMLLPRTRLAEALVVAEKLRLALTESPILVDGERITVTASFGVAPLDESVVSIAEMLVLLRPSLSVGKLAGKNRVGNGNGNGSGAARESEELRAVLRFLQGDEEVEILAQPTLALRDRSVVGYEFLMRGPAGPFQMPKDLFRLAYERNLLPALDLRCLRSAVRRANGLESGLRFHLNLFPSTLLDTPPERLVELIQGIAPRRRFCVEVGEQQLIGNPDRLLGAVNCLRAAGLDVAIDDVGFGRSSLESLIVLEPNVVKIDRAYIQGIARDDVRRRRLERLLGIIRRAGVEIIAEGVETEADCACVEDMGVALAQGYYLGAPHA